MAGSLAIFVHLRVHLPEALLRPLWVLDTCQAHHMAYVDLEVNGPLRKLAGVYCVCSIERCGVCHQRLTVGREEGKC